MSDTDRDSVETLIGLIEHNKKWKGLQDIDVEAYEQSVLTLRALLAAKEAAEAEAANALNQLDSARHSEECLKKRCEELWAEAAALREALLPFYDAARERVASAPEWRDHDTVSIWATIGDLRQALATLDQPKEGDSDDG